jgi:hypothetical protein
VDPNCILHTDGAKHYKYSAFNLTHEGVDHSKQFARPGKLAEIVHTNSAPKDISASLSAVWPAPTGA